MDHKVVELFDLSHEVQGIHAIIKMPPFNGGFFYNKFNYLYSSTRASSITPFQLRPNPKS